MESNKNSPPPPDEEERAAYVSMQRQIDEELQRFFESQEAKEREMAPDATDNSKDTKDSPK